MNENEISVTIDVGLQENHLNAVVVEGSYELTQSEQSKIPHYNLIRIVLGIQEHRMPSSASWYYGTANKIGSGSLTGYKLLLSLELENKFLMDRIVDLLNKNGFNSLITNYLEHHNFLPDPNPTRNECTKILQKLVDAIISDFNSASSQDVEIGIKNERKRIEENKKDEIRQQKEYKKQKSHTMKYVTKRGRKNNMIKRGVAIASICMLIGIVGFFIYPNIEIVTQKIGNEILQTNTTHGALVDNTRLYNNVPSSQQGSGQSSPQKDEFSVTLVSPPTITRTLNYRISDSLSTLDSHGLHKDTNGNGSSGNFYTEEARYSSYDLKTEELEKEIHGLINQERIKNGLPVLSYSDDLAFIARTHSYDMATRNYFSHDTPEGLTPEQRGTHIGYTTCGTLDAINLSEQYDYDVKLFESTGKTDQNLYNKLQGEYQQLQTMHLYLVGENIFQNNIYDSYETTDGIISHYDWNDPDKIATSTVQGWMNSTGHRENILTAWHTEGIGVEISDDYKVYITEDFC